MRRKQGFPLFLSACIPGCGQLYQGYSKRGISLLGFTCLTIAAASLLQIGELAILLPAVWLFSFFDTYNLQSQTEEQAASNPDAYLFGLQTSEQNPWDHFPQRKHRLFGWVLIALGVYVLLSRILYMIAIEFDMEWLYHMTVNLVPSVLVSLFIIILGAWFVRGPKKKDQEFSNFAAPELKPNQKEAFDDGES